MKLSLSKFPALALFSFFLFLVSTSCNKETDLVSEFVVTEKPVLNNGNQLAKENLDSSTKDNVSF
ncbi:hypothetical protein PP182_00515 [Maribacter sp. PR1]|uniref:hypothetical protein n=1 Tax=Maribacter TaxID=252356 RepID=UPI002349D8EC|nr:MULTISPECIES: hypothetical protein [Maribacter]MDC6387145.1 hypothetical protein [Maribacter sp. PR1]